MPSNVGILEASDNKAAGMPDTSRMGRREKLLGVARAD
jgi:hypothetical protein